jgi:hypothetical protein
MYVMEDLARTFSRKQLTKSTVTSSFAKPLKHRSVLDSTRERNVGIVLQFLRMSVDDIMSIVEEFDHETASEETVNALLGIFPTEDEQRAVMGCLPDQRSSVACQFFYACAQRPKLELRLRCWLSMFRFEGSLDQLRQNICDVTEACSSALGHEKLMDLLMMLLSCCNELNKCLPALKGARGFSMKDLGKFRNFVSSSDPSMSLLSFATQHLNVCRSDFVVLKNSLQGACKVDLDSIEIELRELAGHIDSACEYAKSSPSKEIQSFIETSRVALEGARLDAAKMKESVGRFTSFFCWGDSAGELMSTLAQFIHDVMHCASV